MQRTDEDPRGCAYEEATSLFIALGAFAVTQKGVWYPRLLTDPFVVINMTSLPSHPVRTLEQRRWGAPRDQELL